MGFPARDDALEVWKECGIQMDIGLRIRRFNESTPVPTARAVWLAGLGVAIAILWGWRGILVLDLGLLFLCVLDHAAALRGGEMRSERKGPRHLLQGVSQDMEILLRNMGDRPRVVRVRDQPPRGWKAAPVLRGVVPARSARSFHYPLIPPERGVYTFGDLFMRVEGPLGLVSRPLRLEASREIKVFPRLQPLRYSDLATYRRVARQWGLQRARWRGEGREFEALREYVEGDDPRKIHWKASARLDRPIVQEFQPEKNQIVMILLDAGRLMSAVSEGKSKLDHALEATVQLTHTALSGGDQVGVLAFTDRVISFVPPKGRPDQLQMILEGTLSLRPSMVEPQYEEAFLWLRSRVRRRSLVVIFTDLLDEVASGHLLDAVTLLRPRHLPLCVTVRESEWDDLLDTPPSSTQAVYRQSVLLECLRQRGRALRRLVERGALAMDLPPSRLTPGTMERYLEVKGRGLL
jgi:uncharacterized protein (DUF58 family)